MFISVHATRAWGILKEHRPISFTADEQLLYNKTFSVLSPQQFNTPPAFAGSTMGHADAAVRSELTATG